MKSHVLVFLGGLLVGALGVLVLQETTARSGTPAAAVTQEDLEKAVARALRGVENQIADLREKAESRLDRTVPPAGTPETSSRTPSPEPGAAADASEGRARRPAPPTRRDREPLPAARVERLREVEGFQRHEDVRRRWLFRDDADVLADLGTPDQVDSSESGVERWLYKVPSRDADGAEFTQTIVLDFRDGRLIRVETY